MQNISQYSDYTTGSTTGVPFPAGFKTSSGTHTASHPMGTVGSFLGRIMQSGRGVKLSTHLRLVSNSRRSSWSGTSLSKGATSVLLLLHLF